MAAVMGPSGSGMTLLVIILEFFSHDNKGFRQISECRTPGHIVKQMVLAPTAGKYTFLDLLAGRKTTGELKGNILFSGVQPTMSFLKHYAGMFWAHSSLLIPF